MYVSPAATARALGEIRGSDLSQLYKALPEMKAAIGGKARAFCEAHDGITFVADDGPGCGKVVLDEPRGTQPGNSGTVAGPRDRYRAYSVLEY